MTFIDVPHHLSMRANEGPTPFPVTGYTFINSVSTQFTSINSMGRFHPREQLYFRIIKIKFIIGIVEDHWIKLVHSTGKFCCVAPIGIVDDGPQAADYTSIN